VSWTRRWHKAGSALLLTASGLHGALHWRAYVAPDLADPARRAAVETLQAYVLYPPLGTTLWHALGFFSLAWAAGLALLGTTHWILAREADPRTLRRHALRTAVLCLLAFLLAAWLHPLPQGLAIFALAAVLFACAALPRPDDL
jgi:hypothetical protein